MNISGPTEVAATRLYRLAREPRPRGATPNAAAVPSDAAAQCELCAAPIAAEHRHLLDVAARRLVCTCQACSVLFPSDGPGRRPYRMIPERVRTPSHFVLDDAVWAELGIPVDIAFFFFDTAAGRVVALYPSAVGVTESRLPLDAWAALVDRNPRLGRLEPDVEALLVNRANGARDYWLVGVDVCYRLSGVIRRHWKGLGGGDELWAALASFLDDLRRRAAPEPNDIQQTRNSERTA